MGSASSSAQTYRPTPTSSPALACLPVRTRPALPPCTAARSASIRVPAPARLRAPAGSVDLAGPVLLTVLAGFRVQSSGSIPVPSGPPFPAEAPVPTRPAVSTCPAVRATPAAPAAQATSATKATSAGPSTQAAQVGPSTQAAQVGPSAQAASSTSATPTTPPGSDAPGGFLGRFVPRTCLKRRPSGAKVAGNCGVLAGCGHRRHPAPRGSRTLLKAIRVTGSTSHAPVRGPQRSVSAPLGP
jgi:hypothetical protein